MTGANLINFLQPDVGMNIENMGKSSKSGSNGNDSAVFADFMKQTPGTKQTRVTRTGTGITDDSYKQFKYKDKTIDKADENPIKTKVKNSQEAIEDFEEKLVETVSKELGVSQDDIEEAMAVLGLNVFDLLNPSNLAELTVNLTGGTDSIELLTDSSFQNLLTELSNLGEELLSNLEITPSQFDELVAIMTETEDVTLDSEVEEVMDMDMVMDEAQEQVVMPEENSEKDEKSVEIDISTKDDNSQKVEGDEADSQINIRVEKEENTSDTPDFSPRNNNSGMDNENNAQPHVLVQEQLDVNGVTEQAIAEPEPFLSTDTVEIIHQIVEKIQVNASSEISNMELQLNPENLGRIYVNISSKEGNVSAQIMATNDIVKEALENQMLELKENLTQAGVKVDALEVTIASHEFERNLEQDQSRQEQEGARQEELSGKRRNINISSLDDLTGLMTEEETLVAQMMIDNGNSVDLTA